MFHLINKFLKTKENTPKNIQKEWDAYTDSIHELSEWQVKDSKLVSNRVELLRYLPTNGVVAELGVEHGKYSKSILSITRPQKLILIDVSVSSELEKNLSSPLFKNATFIQNDSVTALKEFPDKFFDFIYIDTTHTYEQTKKELLIARRKIKKSGYICGHDYILYSYVENKGYGVVQAVHEFCYRYRWKLKFLTLEPHGYHSFVLQMK